MRLRNGWYNAEKGNHFVLTQKGKNECASYSHKVVGEPVDEYDTEAVHWAVEKGYVIEVPIPDWIVKEGYEVVYKHNSHELHAGNPIVFPERELAEKYMQNYQKHPWFDKELYIITGQYEGRRLRECEEYDGRKVYNIDWNYGIDAMNIGDLFDEEVVEHYRNCLMPACDRADCMQLGEISSTRVDESGNFRNTYETFKKIADGIWEYCGDCFRGENIQRGTYPTDLLL